VSETELHCDLCNYLIGKGIPEDEVSRVLLEAAINSMLSEDMSSEDIIESVELILEEENANVDDEG